MMDKNKKYTRLPGRRGGLFGYRSLWLADDHLLAVFSRGFTEEYKRFYFKDIQAIQTRVTVGWVFGLLGLLIFMGLLGLLGVEYVHQGGEVFLILAGVVLLAFIYSLWLGRSCRTYIQTAVQSEKLSSLSRVRFFRKAMTRIRPLIIEAQGEIRPENQEFRDQSGPAEPVT